MPRMTKTQLHAIETVAWAAKPAGPGNPSWPVVHCIPGVIEPSVAVATNGHAMAIYRTERARFIGGFWDCATIKKTRWNKLYPDTQGVEEWALNCATARQDISLRGWINGIEEGIKGEDGFHIRVTGGGMACPVVLNPQYLLSALRSFKTDPTMAVHPQSSLHPVILESPPWHQGFPELRVIIMPIEMETGDREEDLVDVELARESPKEPGRVPYEQVRRELRLNEEEG